MDERGRLAIWLDRAIKASGKKATPFANDAGVSPSTILRALNGLTEPTLTTVLRICDAHGLSPPEWPIRYQDNCQPEVLRRDQNVTKADRSNVVFECNTLALDFMGILPGDILTVMRSDMASSGDVVIAQISIGEGRMPRDILRLFDQPFLLTRTTRTEFVRKPLIVDETEIRIFGVLIKLERPYRSKIKHE